MKPVIAIFDEFFDNAEVVRTDVVAGRFEDVVNPVDGVVYPGINKDLPGYITSTIVSRLSEIVGAPVKPTAIFARVTTKSLKDAPHKIHSDRVMGQFSAHIYLSERWPTGAGTSFWVHPSQGERHDKLTDVDLVREDQNSPERWFPGPQVQGEFNRALLHDACLWHCAEPVGGWGTSEMDGRLVITCFFNVEENAE